MVIMKAEDWKRLCKAQSTMKCKKCKKVLYGWKELNNHKEENWDHFEYECVGFEDLGVCFA